MARISVSSEAEVVEAVRAARDSRRTLEILGAGTKRGFGRPVEYDDVLDLSGLRGIVAYEPDELIITVRAGTPVAEIEAALAEKNQRLGFEPADWGPLFGAPANMVTIGGVISANANGSAAIRYGRCRDHLLGFRAVNGFGEAYKGGGRVVKNVTGFDLPKLFCGAMGTLGPLTEVTLRVFPRSVFSQTFAIPDCSPTVGLALLRRVWSSPLESTGLAFRENTAFIRLDGSRAALDEKAAMLRSLFDEERREITDGNELFREIASGYSKQESADARWRIHLSPGNAEQLIAALQPPAWSADWAGAVLWLACDAKLDVRQTMQSFDARAIHLHGDQSVAPFAPEEAEKAALTQRIKAAFDPLRLFNPGRMWEGI